jgi:tetratricopeptide (TPR) repeat protein
MKSGLAALQKSDYAAAKTDFQAVVDNNKNNKGSLTTYAWYNLGVIAQTQNKFSDAITNYQNAISLMPAYRPALFNLATAQTSAGQKAAALTIYERILAITPKDANTLFYAGLLNYELGNQATGRDQINQAIAIAPSLAARVPANVTLK